MGFEGIRRAVESFRNFVSGLPTFFRCYTRAVLKNTKEYSFFVLDKEQFFSDKFEDARIIFHKTKIS